MSEIHLIKDESLGGVLREYVEVDRKAEIGDYVVITEGNPCLVYKNVGEIVKIIEVDCDTYGGMFKPHDEGEKGAVYHFQSRTLEPTNIVQIDGQRYKLVDRKAKAGEKVMLVNPAFDYDEYELTVNTGDVFEVIRIEHEVVALKDTDFRMYHSEYNVLEPIESSPEILDLLANLARRVTELESAIDVLSKDGKWAHQRITLVNEQLSVVQGNVERQAQELENKAHEVNAKIEMSIDERTQPSAIDNAMKAIEYIVKAYGGKR